MTKLPRLPRPGNVLEAKYTAAQMREYARKCVDLATAPKPDPKPDPMNGYKERCQHGVRWEKFCPICDERGAA